MNGFISNSWLGAGQDASAHFAGARLPALNYFFDLIADEARALLPRLVYENLN